MGEKCLTCGQMILPGEKTDTFNGEDFHERPGDCVMAAVRRCIELTQRAATSDIAVKGIRHEFRLLEAAQ